MNKINSIVALLLVLFCGFENALAAGPTSKPAIFVCGDSTSKYNGNETPTNLPGRGKNGSPLAGWGTPIAAFFDPEKVVINNVGHAGTSSMSYYNGDWPRVLPKVNAGDYVLLVFGINDGGKSIDGIGEETRDGANGQPIHTYGWYMAKMATDAQAKGAHVTFLTITTRNMWTNPKVTFKDATPLATLPADYNAKEDKIERGSGHYTQWMKEVAKNLHLPVFDLTNYCADLYEKMGREEVDKLYSDHNHTYLPGAEIVASSIVSGLKALKDSPFTPLLSEKGKALPTADAKYVSENPADAVAPTAATK